MLSRLGLRRKLAVRLSKEFWPRDRCRCPRSSANLSATLLPSRSGVERSKYRRPPNAEGVEGDASREGLSADDPIRRRGRAELFDVGSSVGGCV